VSERIVIPNGIVVTMNDANDVLFGGSVVIEDGRIANVTADPVDTAGARVIDASDMIVMRASSISITTPRSARGTATTCRCGSTSRRAGIR
jgi:formylmethanofuran dehydrogenase subunit A